MSSSRRGGINDKISCSKYSFLKQLAKITETHDISHVRPVHAAAQKPEVFNCTSKPVVKAHVLVACVTNEELHAQHMILTELECGAKTGATTLEYVWKYAVEAPVKDAQISDS